jgi:citrate/tricarballylate utilization protein
MRPADLVDRGRHVATVCNSCRYCEQLCPVFPAIERRSFFTESGLAYLANLCHDCGECLFACQYAPPHEFDINLPRTLSALRLRSYEHYCWPRSVGRVFRRRLVTTSLVLVAALSVVLALAASGTNAGGIWPSDDSADFYAVIPHRAMVLLFGAVSLCVVAAMGISALRFWRDMGDGALQSGGTAAALRDAMTLDHLHSGGRDCASNLDRRTPWRRRFHHCTFYGFLLCLASTSTAAVYHSVFGWQAPYDDASLPVLLGTAGGIGLVAGPAGLAWLARRRDPLLGDPASDGLDASFLTLLLLTSVTGLALLVLRHEPIMGTLLVVHLGSVLALLVTLPYGKFVHGLYRLLALVRYHTEIHQGLSGASGNTNTKDSDHGLASSRKRSPETMSPRLGSPVAR